ncbi:DHR11-like protein [Mya arenaria]|uniref:DHR11-like protein n=1 Tax=Mya arenaria TaxID=6604 RepID=A0ABY7FNN8_MYAAR|nr:dehydrogenase/reductase SDR family member 11-like [Mya arenaria]WAR23833.1 DHR11-like protein [Mya arenaria]
MERWEGRVALVTGASSGFGEDIAKRLTELGMKVIGCARNIDKIQALADDLKDAKGSLTAIKCDVSKEEDVLAMFEQIKKEYGGVDVCVNNAGLSHDAPLLSGATDQWRNMFDVNVIGLMTCSREAYKSMKERGVDDGHIILIGSMSAHRVVPDAPSIHCYAATKFAVKAITEGLRNELYAAKTHIRVTHISPGPAWTDFNNRMYKDEPEKIKGMWKGVETLTCEDIADSVVHALSAPGRVQIHDILIRPTEFKF